MGQHPPAESSEEEERGGGMKDVYSACVYLYRSCCLTLPVSTYLFSFFTPQYQPNLNDLNSIWASKHLSLPYLWIMERFSGIQNFIESTPLRFTMSPLLLHSSISHISILSQRPHKIHTSHIQKYTFMNTCINMLTIPL